MAFYYRILLISSLICLTVGNSVLFPYGEEENDLTLEPQDDGTTSLIYLVEDVLIFGKYIYKLHVNTNGVISIDIEFPTFHPQFFPLKGEVASSVIIAPFYADVDTSTIGNIYYRQIQRNPRHDYLFKRVERMIYADFYNEAMLNTTNEAQFMFIATWENVSYFTDKENNRAPHTNTFQAVLLSTDDGSYAIFNYDDINWTTGVSGNSKAEDDGTGGSPGAIAKVGFNAGDGEHFFMLKTSGTNTVVNVDETSNIGIDGRWIFRIDRATHLDIQPGDTVITECLPGWEFLEIEYACYKFFNRNYNWWDAKYSCEMEGGWLAASTTEEKNTFIAGPITGGVKTWLGGKRDPYNETIWEWITGEDWYYNIWRQREPNNWGNAEDCLNTNFVRPGLWNDHFCQNTKPYICEMIPIATYPRGVDASGR